MPALPLLGRRIHDAASAISSAAATAAEDTRIIDARGVEGLRGLVKRAASSLYTTETGTLARRQSVAVCDAGYIAGCYQGLNAGPNPGAVVGIVLGAIAGFLLLLWLLFTLSSGSGFIQTSNLHEEDAVVTHHRHNHNHSRSRSPPRRSSHRSSYREEMRQTSKAAAPRRDRVVRQERISREIPRDVSRSRVRETVIVDESRPERRVDGDDVIEVIAEGSDMTTSAAPPPRRKSGRRSSGYRSVTQHRSPSRSPSLSPDARIESGYRRVDPSRFAGGGFRQHHV